MSNFTQQVSAARVLSNTIPRKSLWTKLLVDLQQYELIPLLDSTRKNMSALSQNRIRPDELVFGGKVRNGHDFDYTEQSEDSYLFWEIFLSKQSVICVSVTPYSSFGIDTVGGELYERKSAGLPESHTEKFDCLWDFGRLDICSFSKQKAMAESDCLYFVQYLKRAVTEIDSSVKLDMSWRRCPSVNLHEMIPYQPEYVQFSPCSLLPEEVLAAQVLTDQSTRNSLLRLKRSAVWPSSLPIPVPCIDASLIVGSNPTLSPLAMKLLDKNHWLTLHLSNILSGFGIDNNNIAWSVIVEGEEVDVLAKVHEELWLFELKGKEFGVGDARAFRDRCELFKPDAAFIVTTDIVSSDSTRLLTNLKVQKDIGYSCLVETPVRVCIVDKDNQMETILKEQLMQSARNMVSEYVGSASAITGFDIGLLVCQYLNSLI